MASQPIHVDPLEVALETFLDTLRNGGENSIQAWRSLQSSYDKESGPDKEKVEPFTSWCLRMIDVDLIKTVSRLIHAAHFKLLPALKLRELWKLANAFQTSKWIIYFILGESTIESSTKILRHIARFKRTSADLTLAKLATGLEKTRRRRRKNRSRSSSNDLTKFTLSDATSAFPLPIPENPPAAPRTRRHQDRLENVYHLATPHQSKSSPTPPYSDMSDADMDNADNDDDTSSDVEQPRKSAVLLDDHSFDLDNISGIKEPRTTGYIRRRLEFSPVHNNDEIPDDDGGFILDGPSDSDSNPGAAEEPEKLSQHLTKLWGKPGELLRYHRVAILDPRHLREFDESKKLSDESINYCSKSLVDSFSMTSDVFTQSSLFYTKLCGSGDTIDYDGVSNWARNTGCVSLCDAKYLVLPIHDDKSQHWFLVIAGNVVPGERLMSKSAEADGPTAFVTTVDSLGHRLENRSAAENIRSYICHEARRNFDSEFNESRIEIKVPHTVLIQRNDRDCGIYVLENINNFLANPTVFLKQIFSDSPMPAFCVTTARARLANGIISDKQQQDIIHGDGAAKRHITAIAAAKKDLGEGTSAGKLELVPNVEEEVGDRGSPKEPGIVSDAKVDLSGGGSSENLASVPNVEDDLGDPGSPEEPALVADTKVNLAACGSAENPAVVPEVEENLGDCGDRGSSEKPVLVSDVVETGEARQITPIPDVKEEDLGVRGDHGTTEQLSYKRQRTMAQTLNIATITLSPQSIAEAVMTVKQLSQLGPVLLSGECQQADPVDSTIWNLFKSYISVPVAGPGPAVPIDIIKSMGFPCVSRLPEAFHLNVSPSDDCDVRPYIIDAYLACLADYNAAVEKATASAYVLRELIRRSRDGVRTLQVEFESDIERIKVQVVPASTMRTYVLSEAQTQMSLLVLSLEGLFEGTQDAVVQLREYGQAVQHAQKSSEKFS
ncbi:hypothetical protein V500_00759 [Pseudogymnoascus sp. VKM F-4518 (FW-2643)]|nr:hypothetical protein V500_00759 [Pseudogymnoascus sp. VKM F-4518 (FW-2643)]